MKKVYRNSLFLGLIVLLVNIFPSITIAQTENLCSSTFTDSVQKCLVSFEAKPLLNKNYQFTWNFGDNTGANGIKATHQYKTNGTFNVCLTTFDPQLNCESEYCKEVTISKCNTPTPSACNAEFNYQLYNCTGTFQAKKGDINNTNTYSWTFGDSSVSNSSTAKYTFKESGIYDVCLTVSNDSCTNTICKKIEVKCGDVPPPPMGDCDAKFHFKQAECKVYFYSGYKQHPDSINNHQLNYSWDFGDGSSGNGTSPEHKYDKTGIYNVCLTVVSDSCKNTFCQKVEVKCGDNPPPNGDCKTDFSYKTYECAGYFNAKEVHHNDSSTNDSTTTKKTTYSWNFGDGTTGEGINVEHKYLKAGVYKVCLKAYLGVNCESIVCHEVKINCGNDPGPKHDGCNANFYMHHEKGIVYFKNASEGKDLNIKWDFGDGNTSDEYSPKNDYQDEGEYTVCLYVSTKDDKCKSSHCHNLYISNNDSTEKINSGSSNSTADFSAQANNSSISVNLENLPGQVTTISIYNTKGEKIYELKNPNKNSLKIPVTAYGMYMINIQTTEGNFIKKVALAD